MSKKAINQAIKNVKLAGYFTVNGGEETKKRQYEQVKKNADALSMLGIMDWVVAFDILFDEYNKEIIETTELNKQLALIKTTRI